MRGSRSGLTSLMRAPSTPRPVGGSPMARRSSGVTPTVTNSMIRSPGPRTPSAPYRAPGELHRELDDRVQHAREATTPTRARAPPRAARPSGLARAMSRRGGDYQSAAGGSGRRMLPPTRPDPTPAAPHCSMVGRRTIVDAFAAAGATLRPPARPERRARAPGPGTAAPTAIRSLRRRARPRAGGVQHDGVGARGQRTRSRPRADACVVGPGPGQASTSCPAASRDRPISSRTRVVGGDQQDAKLGDFPITCCLHVSKHRSRGDPGQGSRVPFPAGPGPSVETPSGG